MKDLVFENNGARGLGEVALVSDPSPISQSGITFFNTLFDENASNHLAIGSAYATSVKGGENFETEEELREAGLNRADVHVDFMIGGPEMNVDGIREDGTVVPIFRNGDWAIQFNELKKIRNEELSNNSLSLTTLDLLELLIDNVNNLFRKGLSIKLVLELGTYLRNNGDDIDFNKLNTGTGVPSMTSSIYMI